ncbi:unnamed protein product [Chilo suppressalis]|uniref:Zinc finger C2H2 LYAR-type domain-containing protein n=1 Tax=Chilo suppressalis TaxID=168631 RepID=A0ABN8B0L6_CHISP|nr:unnamed protein product [Chilo suppressalis]
MVVFTCGHCGESVQKPKVEKHYLTKCRNRNPNLSCMDCFKDFFGQDYESHIKCITEEERYSGKGFTAKEKKGEKKQTAWVEMLQSVLDEQRNAPANVLKIVETISKHNNTPRKKPKFFNFVKNVCGQKTSPKDIDQAWDLISVKLSALTTNGNQNKNKDSSDHDQATNGDAKEKSKNGEVNGNGVENDDKCESVNGKQESDETENAAGNPDKENIESGKVNDKKLSKKQRKEEKKRLKYEAELQSAEAPLATAEEEEGADAANKKGKKKKNRTESAAKDDDNNPTDSKNKHKKRKRQDTTSSAVEVAVIHLDNAETLPVTAEKTQKKKLKVDEIATEDSICLHDQNVAKSEEVEEVGIRNEKFDWHEVILSVLEKKGNELPFKRLQKKVLSEYTEMTGREVDDRIADKFIKKLKSAPKVKVDKNRVFLEE